MKQPPRAHMHSQTGARTANKRPTKHNTTETNTHPHILAPAKKSVSSGGFSLKPSAVGRIIAFLKFSVNQLPQPCGRSAAAFATGTPAAERSALNEQQPVGTSENCSLVHCGCLSCCMTTAAITLRFSRCLPLARLGAEAVSLAFTSGHSGHGILKPQISHVLWQTR